MDIGLNNLNTQNVVTSAYAKIPDGKERDDQEKKSITTSDKVTISKEGQELSEKQPDEETLSTEEEQEVADMKARDQEVRTHEQAHLSAAGGYAQGGASFTMETGPDGNSYAVAGEVGIDISEASTPAETVSKMRTVQQAALAPAQPSSTDRSVAAQAAALEQKAQQEVTEAMTESLDSAGDVPKESNESNSATNEPTNQNNSSYDKQSQTSIYLTHFASNIQSSTSNEIAIA